MRTACFIPIKSRSERVPGKNFRPFAGRPLYTHIIDAAIAAECFDLVAVDTNSAEIAAYATHQGCEAIWREDHLATNDANGNDLLAHHATIRPDFDLYFQAFATAPRLTPGTIAACVELLGMRDGNDSILTVTQECGWYWFNGQPVNYRPGILPRSQDAPQVVKESTGLYGIRREALMRYRSRIGASPYFYLIDPSEAVDIDTEADYAAAAGAVQHG